jgi:CRP/FNR family transcriptional regulator, cyclic AMP receptor protein
VSLFTDCTDDELRRIAEISTVVEQPTGTALTTVGAPGYFFFLIMDGRVSVETPVGQTDPLQAGDFFGEMSLVDGESRSATIHGSHRRPAARR